MSIVKTLQRPHTNGLAKMHGRVSRCRLDDAEANERANRAETKAAVDELQMQRDRALKQEAMIVLRTSSYQPVRSVSCEVCNCVLILRGRVPSYFMKQIAQTVVRHVLEGGMVIDNQLEVDRT